MARKDTMKQLKEVLLKRREALIASLNREMESLKKDGRTVMSDDISDAAIESAESEVASTLAEADSKELTLIEGALGRIKDGSFGKCKGCKKDIPLARLTALPFAERCISCQEQYEKDCEWGDVDEDDDEDD